MRARDLSPSLFHQVELFHMQHDAVPYRDRIASKQVDVSKCFEKQNSRNVR